ncbi:MAG: metallophosphoesterase family protein [Candidatus Margulisiibacteriota bacterium]
MLYGIIADIHSNLEAFEVVLHELRRVDQIVCLGDVIGYGPNPNECIRVVQERNIPTIAGNHDKAAVGEMSLDWFVEHAKEALIWTGEQLTISSVQYLKSLPLTLEFPDFQVVHGSLRSPLEEYIETFAEAVPNLELMEKPRLFVGHTHRPICVVKRAEGYDGWVLKDKQIIKVSEYQKVLINPGGVGQPRDGDSRASFGIYDTEKEEFVLHRVAYNIAAVQEKMRKAGLPEILIARLEFGR